MRFAFAALIALTAAVPQDPAPPQDSHKVLAGPMKVELAYDGILDPTLSSAVHCKLEAYQGELVIADKPASHGQRVKKGDALMNFESKKLEEQLRVAENDLAAARAGRDKGDEEWKLFERGEKIQMDAAVREAKTAAETLELWKTVDLPGTLKDLELDVLRMQDSIDDQREELAQLEKMYKSEELTNATAEIVVMRSKRQLERSLVQQELTKVRVKRQKEHALPQQEAQIKASAEQSAHSLETLQKTAPHARKERETGLVRSKAEVARQEEAIAKLKQDVAALSVMAPVAGRAYYGAYEGGRWSGVAEGMKGYRVGEKTQAGQTLFTIVGDEFDARLDVPEKDLWQVTGNQSATVVPTAFPSISWNGSLSEPAPVPVQDGLFAAHVSLSAKGARLAPGMHCKITVKIADISSCVQVPATAITDQNGKKTVVLKGSDKPREVKTGHTDGTNVEILEGLKEGDEIVLKK